MKITLIAAALVLVLAGCSGTTAPSADEAATPSPSASTSATPRPSSTATNAGGESAAPIESSTPVAAAVITITGKGLVIEGANGETIARLSYFSDPADAVDALTSALGFAPTSITPPQDTSMVNPSVAWDFDGFTLVENGHVDHRGWLYALRTTVASVRGVSISSLGAVGIGDPIANSAFPYPPALGFGGTAVVNNWEPGGYSSGNALVTYSAPTTTSAITLIYAPSGE